MDKSGFSEVITTQLIQPLHSSFVMSRRVKVLAHHLSNFIPSHQRLKGLDVGCGSGEIATYVTQLRPEIDLKGVDVLVRHQTHIPVEKFDGKVLPFADQSFDFVMLVDVLHHAEDPEKLLGECVRVSRSFVLIKDHIKDSRWDGIRLQFMDWVGNRSYGVSLPYHYLSEHQWQQIYQRCQLIPNQTLTKLRLYPFPFSLIFDDHLHFISNLRKNEN